VSTHPSLFSVEIEEWRDITNLKGYQVSSFGNIRTLWIARGRRGVEITDQWRVVRSHDEGGYLRFNVTRSRKVTRFSVHQCVCEAFHGKRPPLKEAAHFPDRNRHNNRADNLSWKTPKENQADRKIHGTDSAGEKNGRSKLTESVVREIRNLYKDRRDYTAIGSIYGISMTAARRVINFISWKHVT